jgi:YesN/AraC family two-component response regulator
VIGDLDYNRCPPLVKRFFALLEDYFLTLKMPADYADLLAVTPAYLNELVKRSCGFTTSYCIQQRIVAEAKRLIMNSELSLKEISYRLGFDDASHFSKFFKKFTGKRYSDFRRQIIN